MNPVWHPVERVNEWGGMTGSGVDPEELGAGSFYGGILALIIEVAHDVFNFTTADENVPDSPFEGGEGVVSVPDWTVPSIKGQPPGSQGCRPPLLRGIFIRGGIG